MIQGVLEDASSAVKNSKNGPWTRYDLTIGGKAYQVNKDVFEAGMGLLYQTVLADVEMRMNGEWENWRATAIFDANDPNVAAQAVLDRPAAPATQVAAPQVVVNTKGEEIARMAAVKHLIEAGFPGVASASFMAAARILSDFYLTGELEQEQEEEELEETFVHPDEDPDIPFMPTIYDNNY
jgi:hypothetical protein